MIGLIVEWTYDEAAYSEFIRRILGTTTEIVCRPCAQKGKFNTLFPVYLKEFQAPHIQKAIVIRDADGKDPEKLLAEMQSRIGSRSYRFPHKLLLAVQEMEAWLLADELALSQFTGKEVWPIPQPEAIFDPKDQLKRILYEGKVDYTQQTAASIAAGSDLNTVAQKCPRFRMFSEFLLS